MLASRLGSFEGLHVADLFAGTGALGLEALSRGARFAVFGEDHPASRALIRDNVERLRLTGAPAAGLTDGTGVLRIAHVLGGSLTLTHRTEMRDHDLAGRLVIAIEK